MNLEEAYKTLELEHGASKDEAKKAFRSLSKKYHPDISKEPNAEEKFKKINEAYQTIENPPRERGFSGSHYSSHSGGSGFGGGFGFDISDFADMMRQQQQGHRHPPVYIKETISFMDAAMGCSKKITFKRICACQSCQGDGGIKTVDKCDACEGKGFAEQRRGNHVLRSECHICEGSGKKIESCKDCNGTGEKDAEVTGDIKIPAGIMNGSKMQINNAGNYVRTMFGKQLEPAILHIFVESDPDMELMEDGNIISDINISLLEALSGTKKKVRTITGEMTLNIRAKSKNNDKMQVAGYGAGRKGNHIFTINVNYPENEEQIKKLIDILKENKEEIEKGKE